MAVLSAIRNFRFDRSLGCASPSAFETIKKKNTAIMRRNSIRRSMDLELAWERVDCGRNFRIGGVTTVTSEIWEWAAGVLGLPGPQMRGTGGTLIVV